VGHIPASYTSGAEESFWLTRLIEDFETEILLGIYPPVFVPVLHR